MALMCFQNEDSGVLSSCFIDLIAYSAAVLLFWIAAVWRIRSVLRAPAVPVSYSKQFILKELLQGAAAVVAVARILAFVAEGVPVEVTLSSLFVGLTWIFALVLTAAEYSRAEKSSWVLLAWWTTAFVLASLSLQSSLATAAILGVHRPDVAVQVIALIVGGVLTFVGLYINRPPPGHGPQYGELADEEPTDSKPTEEHRGGLLSRLSFGWIDPLLAAGTRRPLEMTDLWRVPRELSSAQVNARLRAAWEVELMRDSPSLFRALARAFGRDFMLAGALKLTHDIVMFASPVLLRAVIAYVQSPGNVYLGLTLALLLFLTSVSRTLLINQYFFRVYKVAMQVRSAVIAAVYAKAFHLSNKARTERTVGEIVNLQSVDAGVLQELLPYLHVLWSAPFQLTVALVMLWQVLGPSIFTGVAIMVLTVPVSGYCGKKLGSFQEKMMESKDARAKLMNEILNGIRVVKVFAWETSFVRKIGSIRDAELKQLRDSTVLRAALNFFWSATPVLVSVFTFTTYTLLGNQLTPESAFTALALFDIVRFPLNAMPMVISMSIQARVSLGRLQTFLRADEIDRNAVRHADTAHDKVPNAVEITAGTFGWSDSGPATLTDINLRVPRGKLTAVVGAVGSGKSSLLNAMLGDIPKRSGNVVLHGRVAYVAQIPWIQNCSVRDNILFGSPFEADRYNTVIKACELLMDLKILPDGDRTEIGERGINLSGGQKQRIALARAVYQDCDVYLFDDPLSAVDANVGKAIFDNCLCGLLRDKTRVLVLHQLQYVSRSDLVVTLKDGRIDECGSSQALMQANGDFAKLIRTHLRDHNSDEGKADASAAVSTDGAVADGEHKAAAAGPAKPDAQLISAEERAVGTVGAKVYKAYFASIGSLAVLAGVALCFIFQELCNLTADVWLSFWSDHSAGQPGYFLGVISADRVGSATSFLSVYAALASVGVAIVLFRSVALYLAAIKAARGLHQRLLSNLMRCPMSFFDTTPVGRVLNRLTKDIYAIDESLPETLDSALTCVMVGLGVFVVMGIATPFTLTVILPLAALYRHIQTHYLQASRDLKRLESTTKSPVYAQFSETLLGVATLRAFDREQQFVRINNEKLDTNLAAAWIMQTANRWLGLRLEVLGSLVVGSAACFIVSQAETLNAGFAGLTLVYTLSMTDILNWMVRMYTSCETQMVSVERVIEYSELPSEAELVVPSNRPPASWPSKGAISFSNVQLRYRPGLELVLRGISFDIKPNEKIGVVGRTGAGKSSLVLALFRLVELAGGRITIDGVDIGSIGLHDLRGALSIIMQEPTLFTGSVRDNLDPTGAHGDHELWEALANVHLKDVVQSLEGKLDFQVVEFGENFSVGQKQLLCLACALLKKSKVLVMDEATAAVDFDTDALIQKTIREQFVNTTVLTIAHRVNTIMDSDRILVLDRGAIAEFDTPAALLQNPNSLYSRLLQSHDVK